MVDLVLTTRYVKSVIADLAAEIEQRFGIQFTVIERTSTQPEDCKHSIWLVCWWNDVRKTAAILIEILQDPDGTNHFSREAVNDVLTAMKDERFWQKLKKVENIESAIT